MSRHLLMVSVGPVADFVAASRRTRDIHYSSWLVAEMGRQVAKELSKFGDLVFPVDVTQLNAPVSDRVLCWLHEGVDPSAVSVSARNVAVGVWQGESSAVWKSSSGLGFSETIWNGQLRDNDLVELFSAWVEFDGPIDDEVSYKRARNDVEQLLNARESCTDFRPHHGPSGLQKNSLDGRRESVLDRPGKDDEWRKSRLCGGIKPNEQLDMPGVVKRLGRADETHFVSVSRLAADPFIRGCGASNIRKDAVSQVAEILKSSGDGFVKLWKIKSDDPRWTSFPYDAQLLMPQRLKAIRKEFAELDGAAEVLQKIDGVLSGPNSRYKEPFPYLAVLACDGDNMGKHPGLSTYVRHQEFSRALSDFAKGASQIVNEHRGSLVYAGGDDVLAFLPLDKALDCAEALRLSFNEKVNGTLSVGIAIVHALTPMAGSMIRYAMDAESTSKTVRNALTVSIHKRSGAPLKWTCSWKNDPVGRIRRYVDLIEKDLVSSKAAYDLWKLGDTYADHKDNPHSWADGDLLRAEAQRMFTRKDVDPEIKSAFLDEIGKDNPVNDLFGISHGLIVAKTILSAIHQANGR